MGSYPNLRSSVNCVNYNRRDSLTSSGVRELKRDYVGSNNSLSRKSSVDTKKSSSDSLDHWHAAWDSDHNTSLSSHDDRIPYGTKVIRLDSNLLFALNKLFASSCDYIMRHLSSSCVQRRLLYKENAFVLPFLDCFIYIYRLPTNMIHLS